MTDALHVKLRPLEREDLRFVHQLDNNASVMRYWFEEPYEAFVELSDLYDKHIHDQSERRFVIECNGDKAGQLRDKVFSMGKLVKRIRRADGSRARCCASARLRQSPPLASYSQTFSEPMFGVAAMDHTSSDSASHTASIG